MALGLQFALLYLETKQHNAELNGRTHLLQAIEKTVIEENVERFLNLILLNGATRFFADSYTFSKSRVWYNRRRKGCV